MTSESWYFRKSTLLLLPAPRAPLSVASLMWVPVAQALSSGGDAALIRDTKWKSSNAALPEPPPLPLPVPPLRLTPHDHD